MKISGVSFPDSFAEALSHIAPQGNYSDLGLAYLYALTLEGLQAGVEGDVVECGVQTGRSATILAAALKHSDRKLWLYDVWGQSPAPASKKDGDVFGKFGAGAIGRGEIEAVRASVESVGFPSDRLIMRQGLFQDTFQAPKPEKVLLLHVDADWYDSCLPAFETFYPAVSHMGVIWTHDFGYFDGNRHAFYDFVKKHDLAPLLERVGAMEAFWIKGIEHHRGPRAIEMEQLGLYQPRCK